MGRSQKKGQCSTKRFFFCTLCTCRLCSMKYIISPLRSPERESLTGIKGRCRERQRISSKKFIATVYSEWGSLGNWTWFLLPMIPKINCISRSVNRDSKKRPLERLINMVGRYLEPDCSGIIFPRRQCNASGMVLVTIVNGVSAYPRPTHPDLLTSIFPKYFKRLFFIDNNIRWIYSDKTQSI